MAMGPSSQERSRDICSGRCSGNSRFDAWSQQGVAALTYGPELFRCAEIDHFLPRSLQLVLVRARSEGGLNVYTAHAEELRLTTEEESRIHRNRLHVITTFSFSQIRTMLHNSVSS